ncbi:hypothetical protein, partial [Endozoicomonas atrinae]|uniref:hypothetical protein n=1 Tax=Endozoicomonas atrinae TaxID=1333660 RepID=UPI000A95DFDE
MTVTVRRFTEADNTDLMRLSIKFFAMGKFGRDYHFDEAKAADYLNLHATAPNFAAWIAEEDGQLL